MTPFEQLKRAGFLDPGVLAVGLERGWVTRDQVIEYAVEKLSAGDERGEILELAGAEDLEFQTILTLLRRWANLDGLPTESVSEALRRWIFAHLKSIEESPASPAEKQDQVEELYALLGFPEEMRACSRYYIPEADRARGIQIGDTTVSECAATRELTSSLQQEFADSEANRAVMNAEGAARANRG